MAHRLSCTGFFLALACATTPANGHLRRWFFRSLSRWQNLGVPFQRSITSFFFVLHTNTQMIQHLGKSIEYYSNPAKWVAQKIRNMAPVSVYLESAGPRGRVTTIWILAAGIAEMSKLEPAWVRRAASNFPFASCKNHYVSNIHSEKNNRLWAWIIGS